MFIILFTSFILIYIGFKLIFRFKNSTHVDLDKKVIFITGCDSGIGNESAKYFHKLGFVVFAGCLDANSSGALELKSFDRSLNGDLLNRMHVVQINITQVDSIKNAVEKLDDFLNENNELKFHCLINNAGLCLVGEFDWFTLGHVENVINVNLIGTLKTIKLFLKIIIKHKSRILIIGSVNGIYPYPGISVYCATKSALNLFSQSLRFEMKKFGVRVCVLNPGDYANKTKILSNQSNYFEEMAKNFTETQKALYKGYFERYMQLTDRNSGITGSEDSGRILFKDLRKMVVHLNPPNEILSAPLINRIILTIFFSLPTKIQVFVFQKVWNRLIKLQN